MASPAQAQQSVNIMRVRVRTELNHFFGEPAGEPLTRAQANALGPVLLPLRPLLEACCAQVEACRNRLRLASALLRIASESAHPEQLEALLHEPFAAAVAAAAVAAVAPPNNNGGSRASPTEPTSRTEPPVSPTATNPTATATTAATQEEEAARGASLGEGAALAASLSLPESPKSASSLGEPHGEEDEDEETVETAGGIGADGARDAIAKLDEQIDALLAPYGVRVAQYLRTHMCIHRPPLPLGAVDATRWRVQAHELALEITRIKAAIARGAPRTQHLVGAENALWNHTLHPRLIDEAYFQLRMRALLRERLALQLVVARGASLEALRQPAAARE